MIQQFLKGKWIGPLIAGILTFIALSRSNFLFAWICYVPLFFSLFNKTPKQWFASGLIFGGVIAVFAFYWMIPGAERFTGNSILYGIGVFILSALFLALYFGVLLYCFSKIKISNEHYPNIYINALLAAAVFTVAEALLMNVSAGFPWFDFHSAYFLAGNEYAIQPAAFFGIHILSFVVVFVNYLIAVFLFQKNYKHLFIPAVVIIAYLFAGYLIEQSFNQSVSPQKSFTAAILAENIPPEMKWDDNNGNMLAERLLDLNREAAQLKPDIIVWSESAIPWTYRKDDDLVNEVLKITAPAQVTHIMGINTGHATNEVYNSAYCLLPNGAVAGRYDKQYLLSLVESPINGIIIPFLSSSGFIERKDTAHAAPLPTAYGKAGIMICNECTVPQAAYSAVQQGANFLCNMSNDGWFNDTYIVGMHFYNARLRAVATRKDVVVNCNNGYSGLIQASGKIAAQERSTEPFVKMVTIQPNNELTLTTQYPLLFVYVCAVFIVVVFILIMKKKAGAYKGKNMQHSITLE
ncbi:apolipoprotein N-acyltransferase [Ilyomonas limi]|uniref:Apolipoprotein N-acyltransferase n=1 Tax=Ilyomonas limi TaxID=2575867 RepID=A0A4U3L9V9_9BACT|nr:apolipoprotein N-acyltransferase [Ilyomonas limi]TKK71872.1 apolipoprotein N-acyltransferase [Ilyomonas limi]